MTMSEPTQATASGSRLASPVVFLMCLGFANWIGFASWQALINNFGREAAGFTGADNGLMQSVREIPGFLAFTAVFLFMIMREQMLAYVSLVLLGIGIALTGFYPSLTGILITTTIMSLGFHYMETAQQALSLQILPKAQAARTLGKVASAIAVAQLIAFGCIALAWKLFQPSWETLFLVSGAATLCCAIACMLVFPKFDGEVKQNRGIVLRERYWLYYAITFMSGARRQIFLAFGGFLLVERFGFDVAATASLLLVTYTINTFAGTYMGSLIARLGERLTIQIENISLIIVFLGYALASQTVFGAWSGAVAGGLFILDGVFFIWTIAQKTYFQKIADPADIAPTAAVAFTINHIMAVFLPVTFGLLWTRTEPANVFYIGVGIATVSLILSFLVPRHPGPGQETVFSQPGASAAIQPAE
jgi:predicted MFS family arabinose efflux permease